MRRLLRLGSQRYELLDRYEPHPGERALRLLDPQVALELLRDLLQDPASAVALRDFIAEGVRGQGHQRLRDNEVLEHLAQRLVARRLWLVPHEPLLAPSSPQTAQDEARTAVPDLSKTQPQPVAPPRQVKQKTFIKFVVLDQRTGKPVPGVKLTVKLTDASVVQQETGADGMLEFNGIDPGSCDLQRITDQLALEVNKLTSG